LFAAAGREVDPPPDLRAAPARADDDPDRAEEVREDLPADRPEDLPAEGFFPTDFLPPALARDEPPPFARDLLVRLLAITGPPIGRSILG